MEHVIRMSISYGILKNMQIFSVCLFIYSFRMMRLKPWPRLILWDIRPCFRLYIILSSKWNHQSTEIHYLNECQLSRLALYCAWVDERVFNMVAFPLVSEIMGMKRTDEECFQTPSVPL